jgi:hypothetical protein
MVISGRGQAAVGQPPVGVHDCAVGDRVVENTSSEQALASSSTEGRTRPEPRPLSSTATPRAPCRLGHVPRADGNFARPKVSSISTSSFSDSRSDAPIARRSLCSSPKTCRNGRSPVAAANAARRSQGHTPPPGRRPRTTASAAFASHASPSRRSPASADGRPRTPTDPAARAPTPAARRNPGTQTPPASATPGRRYWELIFATQWSSRQVCARRSTER